ncbi:nitrogen fixation/metabolism regulation signal transduction histidine kinase [Catenulispora sp. GP43]|uniref:hypothetical protein n=1 Tax=Catenulispora sp. GP43 TaxID=3156263 RepID=UPI0035141D0E
MISNSPASGAVLADPNHYSPLFYTLIMIDVIAVLIVFFTIVRFVLRLIDRRSRG